MSPRKSGEGKSGQRQSGQRQSVLLLSGPNLNLLGEREPEIYGHQTLDDHHRTASEQAEASGLALEHLQSNSEAELIDAIQQSRAKHAAIIINAGALTHYSWGIHDALAAYGGVVVELHLSNPSAREEWRHSSTIAPVAHGTIAGFGGYGYRLAVMAVADLLAAPKDD